MGKFKGRKTSNQKENKVVKKTSVLLRKEKRKEQRKQVKENRMKSFLRRHGKVLVTPQQEGQKLKEENEKHKEKKIKGPSKAEKLAKEQRKQRKKQMLQANIDEEKQIKKLEKQLRLNKRKSKGLPASFKEDGLDYLLGVCDSTNFADIEAENSDLDLSKDEESEDENQPMSEDESGDSEDNSSQEEEEDDEPMQSVADDSDHESNDPSIEEGEPNESADSEEGDSKNPGLWEDIYGRTRDAKGNVVNSLSGKYIPPALRVKLETSRTADSIVVAKLSKSIKGALNRLAESNLHVIARQMEDLYMSNSRNLMNECTYKIISASLVLPSLTPDRLVMEHVVLLAILHGNVGYEIGATILQSLISDYIDLYNQTSHLDDIENKMLDNYLQIVSQMYAFQMVCHDLIFDLLDNLCDSFRVKDVELILLVLKAVGFLLRKDDPTKLKTFIHKVQKKSNQDDETEKTQGLSRVQFMLEILLAIKNNNVKKIPNYDPTQQAHLKKIFKSFLRPGASVTPLKVSLEDLTNTETRGRWWLVGSAWAGKSGDNPSNVLPSSSEPKFSVKLLSLARKMRMNTDARKNLFCALMSADDYLDAFERLVKVNKATISSTTRERDTAFVLLTCCLREPTFNPFYSQLALKLGAFDRKYRMAVQCSIWDRIKDMAGLKSNQLSHLALFVSHLIKEKLLSLACLKVIEFSELDKVMVRFIKKILLDIMAETEIEKISAPFLAVAGYPKLSAFRDGLQLFLRHFLLRGAEKEGMDVEELKRKISIAENALTSGNKKLLL